MAEFFYDVKKLEGASGTISGTAINQQMFFENNGTYRLGYKDSGGTVRFWSNDSAISGVTTTGTGASGQVTFWTSASGQTGSSGFTFDSGIGHLTISNSNQKFKVNDNGALITNGGLRISSGTTDSDPGDGDLSVEGTAFFGTSVSVGQALASPGLVAFKTPTTHGDAQYNIGSFDYRGNGVNYGGGIVFGNLVTPKGGLKVIEPDGNESRADMHFQVTDNLVVTTKMALINSGYLGIGTVNPTSGLHVSGSMNIKDSGYIGGTLKLNSVNDNGDSENSVLVVTADGTIESNEIDGSVWTGNLISGENGVDNRVATFTDATTLNGESGLTYDGSTFNVNGNIKVERTGNSGTLLDFSPNGVVSGTTSGLAYKINSSEKFMVNQHGAFVKNGGLRIAQTNAETSPSDGSLVVENTSQFDGNSQFNANVQMTGLSVISNENTILCLDAGNNVRYDDINSKVWNTDLVNGSGVVNQVTFWGDTNEVTGSPNATLTNDGTITLGGSGYVSGHFGVGTITPKSRMHVHSPNSTLSAIQFTNSTTGQADTNDGGQIYLDSGNSDALTIDAREQSQEVVFKTTDGNVVVDIAGPDKFEIDSDGLSGRILMGIEGQYINHGGLRVSTGYGTADPGNGNIYAEGTIDNGGGYKVGGSTGITGTFTNCSGITLTITSGIITGLA